MNLHRFAIACRYILAAGIVLFTMFVCGSCGFTTDQTVERNEETDQVAESATVYTENEGKTGVILEDSKLEECYSLADADIGVSSARQTKVVVKWEYDCDVSAGDIVLVLDENPSGHEGMVRVMLPYGDIPTAYGYIAKGQVSTDNNAIQNGNQALVTDCMTYDAPDGRQLDTMSGVVEIVSREEEWCQVEQLGTGMEAVWVRTDQLSFNFDRTVMDIEQE